MEQTIVALLGERWGTVALAVLGVYVTVVDPLLPPPSASSSTLYKVWYSFSQKLCGNWGHNKNACDSKMQGKSVR